MRFLFFLTLIFSSVETSIFGQLAPAPEDAEAKVLFAYDGVPLYRWHFDGSFQFEGLQVFGELARGFVDLDEVQKKIELTEHQEAELATISTQLNQELKELQKEIYSRTPNIINAMAEYTRERQKLVREKVLAFLLPHQYEELRRHARWALISINGLPFELQGGCLSKHMDSQSSKGISKSTERLFFELKKRTHEIREKAIEKVFSDIPLEKSKPIKEQLQLIFDSDDFFALKQFGSSFSPKRPKYLGRSTRIQDREASDFVRNRITKFRKNEGVVGFNWAPKSNYLRIPIFNEVYVHRNDDVWTKALELTEKQKRQLETDIYLYRRERQEFKLSLTQVGGPMRGQLQSVVKRVVDDKFWGREQEIFANVLVAQQWEILNQVHARSSILNFGLAKFIVCSKLGDELTADEKKLIFANAAAYSEELDEIIEELGLDYINKLLKSLNDTTYKTIAVDLGDMPNWFKPNIDLMQTQYTSGFVDELTNEKKKRAKRRNRKLP